MTEYVGRHRRRADLNHLQANMIISPNLPAGTVSVVPTDRIREVIRTLWPYEQSPSGFVDDGDVPLERYVDP